MPPQETGKQRAGRIPLNYYKSYDALQKWKAWLGWLAVVVPLLWMGSSFAFSNQWDFYSSRGPVAAVHQTWDANCSTCHVNLTPISTDSFRIPLLMGVATESSKKCQSCHAGPSHFKDQPDDRSCGSCHREHGGRLVSLVNLPDSDCTQCHRDVHRHKADSKFKKDIHHFADKSHPDFISLKEGDPGKIKFNHKRHLTAGMPAEKDGKVGDPVMSLGKLPAQFKERYRSQQVKKEDADPVQLNCASCHQLDSGDFGVSAKQASDFPFSIAGKRNGGAYMQPIVYENQCQACHPLSFAQTVDSDKKIHLVAVPHRMQPAEIHELLENFFTGRLARGQSGFLDKKVTRPLPGKFPGLLEPTVKIEIEKEVKIAETSMYLANMLCAECHTFDKENVAAAIKVGQKPDLRINHSNIPSVWLKHAKFNHTAHRAVKCTDCHAGAETSTVASDVLIPNMDNCVKCHAPQTAKAGGARFNCTECHQYHHGEQSLQGVGAAHRAPAKLHTIDDLMRGK